HHNGRSHSPAHYSLQIELPHVAVELNQSEVPHASHHFHPVLRDRLDLHSSFRLRGKQNIQPGKRQHSLPDVRGLPGLPLAPSTAYSSTPAPNKRAYGNLWRPQPRAAAALRGGSFSSGGSGRLRDPHQCGCDYRGDTTFAVRYRAYAFAIHTLLICALGIVGHLDPAVLGLRPPRSVRDDERDPTYGE